jgi:phosphoribosylamine-glycine ligase
MMVSDGYPGEYTVGKHIEIGEIHRDSIIYHAGTRFTNDELVTSGGRVLAITSIGDTIEEALAKSYDSILNINYEGAYYRNDIGHEFI